jgi:hypothetical protein
MEQQKQAIVELVALHRAQGRVGEVLRSAGEWPGRVTIGGRQETEEKRLSGKAAMS